MLKNAGQISPKDALAHLKNGALVIDVRSPGEFNSGHLPAAINIPLDKIETALPRRVKDKNQIVLLHCLSGARSGTAKDKLKNLSVDEFARMAADKQNVILDVRTAKEFSAGHLPAALNLDVTAADFEEKAAALDKRKIYLVHCASGTRSVRACEKLVGLDFPKLYNLPGGFRASVKAGNPVEK